VEKAEPVQVRFTLCSSDQHSIRMQDGCKAYMDSYTASNISCFTVTCIVFKTHLLEVSLTQNRETTTLRTLTTIGLLCFIMCEDPHEHNFIEIAFGWGPSHIWLHTTPPEGPVTYDFTLHHPRVRVRDHATWLWRCVWDGLGTLFFWALIMTWSQLLACVWNSDWGDFWAS
jgi:hypothetical protein